MLFRISVFKRDFIRTFWVLCSSNMLIYLIELHAETKSCSRCGIKKNRWDQVNLLVNGPHQPYFKQKQKMVLNFGQLPFFNLLISAVWKKKKEIKQTYINHQNQEAFINIINYKLRVFLVCLLCKILFSKK